MEILDTLFLQLLKIPSSLPPESLEVIFETLWKTRKTGLNSSQRSYVQSLLSLPSMEDLDPVLASLRMVVRKIVNENLTRDELQKMFPFNLCDEIQNSLLVFLQKRQHQWKEEASQDQAMICGLAVANTPLIAASLTDSQALILPWHRQDGTLFCFSQRNHDEPTSISARDIASLPCFKLMTWTIRNGSSAANRMAIVTLKLQDTESSSVEMEVRFQLSVETLDAMLRSLTYISEQLTDADGTSSEPSQKKHKQ